MPRAKKSIKRDRDFQGSVLRIGAMGGFTFGTLLSAMQADAHDSFGPNTAMFVYPVALILGPLVGYFTGNFLDGAVLKLFAGAFGREGGSTGPQLELASYREATNRQKQARHIYLMLLERYPETWEAGEARERLRTLEAGGFPAT